MIPEESPAPRKAWRWIVLAAVVATIATGLLIGRIEHFREGYYDEGIYRLHARNLIEHHFFGYGPGSSVAYRPPGYPFFEAGIRSIYDSQAAVRAVQSVMAGLTVALAALIAKRLFGAAAAAVSAVLLFAIGTLSVYASMELTETLATATLVASVAAALIAIDKRSVGFAVLGGVLMGLSALTRPQGLPLAIILGACVAVAATGAWRPRAALGLALIAASLLTIAPWTIRNAVRVHAFVPVAVYGGEAFFLANNEKTTGKYISPDKIDPEAFRRISGLPEGQQTGEWFSLAFAFIRAHPLRAAGNWGRNGVLFVRENDRYVDLRSEIRDRWRPPFLDDRWLWPAAAIGLAAAAIRKNRGALLPAAVIVSTIGFFTVFLPLPRFRHAIVPFLAVFAAAGLTIIARAVGDRIRKPSAAASTFA
jgi:4-amino-4-deoxy-L-arabinose transferase-like glycosyltransferase